MPSEIVAIDAGVSASTMTYTVVTGAMADIDAASNSQPHANFIYTTLHTPGGPSIYL